MSSSQVVAHVSFRMTFAWISKHDGREISRLSPDRDERISAPCRALLVQQPLPIAASFCIREGRKCTHDAYGRTRAHVRAYNHILLAAYIGTLGQEGQGNMARHGFLRSSFREISSSSIFYFQRCIHVYVCV